MTFGLVPLLSTLVCLVFALLVFDQYRRRRKPYQAVWTVSLVFYGLGTLAEFLAHGGGWTPTLYRVFYLFGGLLTAAYLGQGTLFLLAPPRVARIAFVVLLALSLVGAIRVLTVPIDPAALPVSGRPEGPRFMPTDVRVLAGILNGLGTIALVGGALWSARHFWLQRTRLFRFWSNLLIAAGALTSAAGSTVLAYSGALLGIELPDVFSLATLLGVLLIFAGFLISIEVFERFNVPFTDLVVGRRGTLSGPGRPATQG